MSERHGVKSFYAGGARQLRHDYLVTEPIGRRMALHRRRRGLSQASVPGLVGRSESWLSQVDVAAVRPDCPCRLHAIAAGLLRRCELGLVGKWDERRSKAIEPCRSKPFRR